MKGHHWCKKPSIKKGPTYQYGGNGPNVKVKMVNVIQCKSSKKANERHKTKSHLDQVPITMLLHKFGHY